MDFKRPSIYVVATPIGNLEDISRRAIDVLTNVDLILAEDTRVSLKLLSLLKIDIEGRKIISYQGYCEDKKAEPLVDRIKNESLAVALISDAGTPCISDPGYRLIDCARKNGIDVVPIPGVAACISLISVSGLPSDRFSFIGFLPLKKGDRKKEFDSWGVGGSFVFYETAKRILSTLEDIRNVYTNAKVCIGRELTKLYEEIYRDSIDGVIKFLEKKESIKGEFSVMVYIEPKENEIDINDIIENAKLRFKNGESLKDIVESLKGCGLSRKKIYSLLLDIKNT